ncbi:MAG TPA: signal peptide peptidase SppA [Nocardioidaceae bacterium]|nr:signal peptide peptidase SppA [Nocardioidaceae bacterium]
MSRLPSSVQHLIPGQTAAPAPLLLEIDLSRGLAETGPTDPLSALRQRQQPTLPLVLDGLRRAVTDERVTGVVVLVGRPIPITHVEELGSALRKIAEAGKSTVAFADSFGEFSPGTVSYALAAYCDEIWLQPSGGVGLTGVQLNATLLRGALDKVGAEPNLRQRHEYKTAANTFMVDHVTEPHREMTQRLADSVMDQIRSHVARRRGLSDAGVDAAVGSSPMAAPDALEHRLVDRLGYRDEVYSDLRQRLGADGELELRFVHRYAHRQATKPAEQLRRRRAPAIAVIAVRGNIHTGRSRPGGPGGPSAGSDTVVAALRQATESDHIKGVVLSVNSPGGSYVASDAIRHAVLGVRAAGKPVVASMGTVAASGGYFVSMPADRIVALPSTLTGSIGVLAGKIVLRQTFDRLGITREAIGSGPQATMFSPTVPFDEEQVGRLDAWLDEVYSDFTHKAAEDRGLEWSVLERQARGRVWTGADAHQHELVDELGGRQRAVQLACELAGLARDQIRLQSVPHVPFIERLRPAESTESPAAAVAVSAASILPHSTDDLVRLAADFVGLPFAGALSLPWRFEVS